MRLCYCRPCVGVLLLMAMVFLPAAATSAAERGGGSSGSGSGGGSGGGGIVTTDRVQLIDSMTFGSANAIIQHLDGRVYFCNDAPAGANPAGGIYRILDNGTVELVVGADRPAGLAVDQSNGDLYYTEDAGGGVYRSSITDFDNITYGPPVGLADLLPGMDMTTAITTLPLGYDGPYPFEDGAIVSDQGLDTLMRLDTTMFPDPGSVNVLEMTAGTDWVSLASSRTHTYVADASATTGGIYELGELDGGSYLTQVDDGTVLMEPVGVAAPGCGRTVYVTTQAQDALYALDPLTGQAELLASGFNDLEPNSVAADFRGERIWVSDRGTSTIYEFEVLPQLEMIRYTFTNVTFEDGGTLSGWFDFDPTLAPMQNCIRGWSDNYEITVSGGDTDVFPPFTYNDEDHGPMRSGGANPVLHFLAFGDPIVIDRQFIVGIEVESWTLGRDLNIPLPISIGNTTEFIFLPNPPPSTATRLIQPGGSLVGVVLGGGCAADLTGAGGPDGVVDVFDLLELLGAWGTPGGDVTGDGTTDVFDLLDLLGAWGPCP